MKASGNGRNCDVIWWEHLEMTLFLLVTETSSQLEEENQIPETNDAIHKFRVHCQLRKQSNVTKIRVQYTGGL